MPLTCQIFRDVRGENIQICDKCEKVKDTKGSKRLFLKSVSVWINKPHVINRRLCGSKIVHVVRVDSEQDAFIVVNQYTWSSGKTNESEEKCLHFSDLVDESAGFTVVFRELIPKSEFFPKLLEAVVYDKQGVKVTFIPIGQDCAGKDETLEPTKELQYQISLQKADDKLSDQGQTNEIRLSWSCDHNENDMPRRQVTSKWLKTTLLERLVNLSEISDISTSVKSLQLVPVDRYKDMYVRLKNKYGKELVENWTERTDPKKFVYEDIAIAAYLLLIWEDDRKSKNLPCKQSFVDLGCGNGLLVYILTKEGHIGCGIDLRKRNIWDTFGPDVDLKVKAISPSADHLFPEYDWIIGNHSDELTPWIPVIAARSSYRTCFFVLPCCHYDFVGKFGQTKNGKSRHESYLNFVKDVVVRCGFKPESDTLRIPSTKRTCFIGKSRSYEQKDELMVDVQRQAFIDKRTIYSAVCHKVPAVLTSITESFEDRGSDFPKFDKIVCPVIISRQNSCCSSSSGDKRKYENLGSTDSGFYDDTSDSTGSKRSKNDSSQEMDDLDQLGDKSSFSNPSLSATVSDSSTSSSPNTKSVWTSFVRPKHQPWAEDFKPRIEPGVRNCQKVPEKVKSVIVQTVFDLVLSAEDSKDVLLSDGKTWKRGGSVSLSDVSARFDKLTMSELKNECGGLQTLLRNHSHIFQVTGGHVQLRDFTSPDPWKGSNAKKLKNKRGNQQDMRKTTLCWFNTHHPDGCPKTKEDCLFAHGDQELRSKLVRQKVD